MYCNNEVITEHFYVQYYNFSFELVFLSFASEIGKSIKPKLRINLNNYSADS